MGSDGFLSGRCHGSRQPGADPPHAWISDQIAFLLGAIVSDVELTPGVLDLLRAGCSPFNGTSGAPLHIVEVTPVHARCSSDRGRPRLPAWQVTIDGATRPFVVRDPSVAGWWPAVGEESMPRDSSREIVRIHPGGTRLSFSVSGTAPLHGRYVGADVFETPQAVHVRPTWQRNEPPPKLSSTARVGGLRLDVELTRPLANRVLLSETGQPLTVLPIEPGRGRTRESRRGAFHHQEFERLTE